MVTLKLKLVTLMKRQSREYLIIMFKGLRGPQQMRRKNLLTKNDEKVRSH